jgi:hypothetical protein
MDTPGFDPADALDEPNPPLARLRPIAAGPSRDRMLYEAGRAAGRRDARRRHLAVLSVMVCAALAGSGSLLVRERSRRLAVERALAALTTQPSTPTVAPLAPEPIVISPDSYLALSRRIEPGGLAELAPRIEPIRPDVAAESPGPITPVRGWTERGILDF